MNIWLRRLLSLTGIAAVIAAIPWGSVLTTFWFDGLGSNSANDANRGSRTLPASL